MLYRGTNNFQPRDDGTFGYRNMGSPQRQGDGKRTVTCGSLFFSECDDTRTPASVRPRTMNLNLLASHDALHVIE